MSEYSRDEVNVPRLSGLPLRALVATLETPGVGTVPDREAAHRQRAGALARHAGRRRLADPAAAAAPDAGAGGAPGDGVARRRPRPARACRRTRDRGSGAGLRDGETDPSAVAARLCAAVADLDGDPTRLGVFIAHRPDEVARDAAAATARWREGRPRSPLDGVPIVVKDELDVAGYPTTLGTSFRTEVARADAAVVARLRAAGAILLGKANMNEIGINPIGLNPHHGPARNPWDRGRITGGSSSGSAAAVAAGLCPISIGADGGGSVRIPAALCGVVGLKATFGRIPETGVPPLCWNVAHVGPLGLTVADVAAAYAVIAGPDDGDLASLAQPPPDLARLADDDLRGLRLGVCTPYFEDAEPDVVARCRDAVRALEARGAEVIELPAPDLNTLLWSHAVIILSEMAAAMRSARGELSRFALDSRTNLAFGRHFLATDLVHAMRHRQRITLETLALLREVDVLVTPTTATTAPAIPERTLPDGESNLPVVDALMRFVRLGNLTGLPALAVPCGLDGRGLPVSVQLLGRPYEEALLLRAGRVIEAATPRATPRHHVRALP
ncbi:MAG: amidase [Kofleriaceae bacterium]